MTEEEQFWMYYYESLYEVNPEDIQIVEEEEIDLDRILYYL